MISISLFSNKSSVLKYWQKYIDPIYEIQIYSDLSLLYNDLGESQPDIILFNYEGSVTEAEELLEYVTGEKLKTSIMVLDSHPVFSEGVRLLRKEAKAFINVYATPENLNQAIKVVMNGNIWLYPEFIQAMIKQSLFSHIEESDMMQKLSPREGEIAQMIALGMSNKEIAKQAVITEQTVKTHLKTIYEKMQVHTRLELAILVNRVDNSYERGIDDC